MKVTTSMCRACRSGLEPLVDLGDICLSGFPARDEADRPRAPLLLCACGACRLVQLGHTVSRDDLFCHYWYQSGINETMRDELASVVEDAVMRVGEMTPNDVVLDIGANDGTLLTHYRTLGLNPLHDGPIRVAYEPARNLQEALRLAADVIVADYFPERYKEIQRLEGRVKIITSIAMVYAVNALAPFLAAIAALLHRDGVWIVQFQDLAQMLQTRAFDNICHEHLCYFSLESFGKLLVPYGLQVVDAGRRAINGGSLRLTVQHSGHQVDRHVMERLAEESGCQQWTALEAFDARVQETIRHIRGAVTPWIGRGRTVDLYGASTKANTLLQVCHVDHRVLRQAWERSPEKVGRRTVGTDIPIVSEEDGRADPPDALLVGIWQFREAILVRESAFLRSGGTLIFPLPNVDLVRIAWNATA
jgi:hypothetical protein